LAFLSVTKKKICNTDPQVRVYALEDTPVNFSTATSLSDLTVDDAFNSGRVSVDSQVATPKDSAS
jgi:hypothetical protein